VSRKPLHPAVLGQEVLDRLFSEKSLDQRLLPDAVCYDTSHTAHRVSSDSLHTRCGSSNGVRHVIAGLEPTILRRMAAIIGWRRTIISMSNPGDPTGTPDVDMATPLTTAEIEQLVVMALLSNDPLAQSDAVEELLEHIEELPTRTRIVIEDMSGAAQAEARLSYAAKTSTGAILSLPPSPLQEWSRFSGNTGPGEWRNMLQVARLRHGDQKRRGVLEHDHREDSGGRAIRRRP
jgi:hypothetical protein